MIRILLRQRLLDGWVSVREEATMLVVGAFLRDANGVRSPYRFLPRARADPLRLPVQ